MSSPPVVSHPRPFGVHPLVLNGHTHYVWSVAFSPSHQLLASASADDTIRLWNTETGADIATLKGHSDTVFSVAFSPDGTTLASGSKDKFIKLWKVGSRAKMATLSGHSGWVWSVAFSPDGASLVSGSSDKTIRLWDVKSRSNVSILKGHSSNVYSVIFSPNGQMLASGSEDKTIQLWDVASRASTQTLHGHSGMVRSLAFSPSGEYLASGSFDKTIRLWNVATGAHIATLEEHSKEVRSVAFSPNGKYIASGSNDHTLRVWDVASRSHALAPGGHSARVWAVAFSPDGSQLASGANDNTVRIWRAFWEEAQDPQASIYMSNSVGLTQDTTYGQQDTTIHREQDTPIFSQQNITTLASTTVPLNNDISGSISLERIELIGFGGFGDVFSGVHIHHGKVALKRPRRLLDEALIRRFLREVDLWCSVTHPHILPCLGMCKIGAEVYVVSPFIEDGDLLSCMARGVDLNRSKLLFEVAEALTHLHHRGVVHGDVKAQNILLGGDGSALLCDFGQAKAFDTMATSTESKGAGSIRWMAPELFLGESRSMASDVYALGVTIAEVLSGHAPYHDVTENFAVMYHVMNLDRRPPKEPLSSPEGKSYATLWETAEKCWVKDVKARPYMAQVLAMLFPLTRERG